MTKNQFDFYEIVQIATSSPALESINGELAAILGMACGDDKRRSYAVRVYKEGIVWSCMEDELRPTGKFDRRESFYAGDSIRVCQDGEILG